jgi:hypothetical protein
MPTDKDASDNIPVQADKIGWRRGLQPTDFRRLTANQLRQYEADARVTLASADDQGDEDVDDPVADFEACASRYFARRTEMTSPEQADCRDETIQITDVITMLLQALDGASDITLDRINALGGVVGGLHQAATICPF